MMRMITSSGSDFNPRSPRGGATLSLLLRWLAFGISIHAPHEGERQMPRHKPAVALTISIHAPHEGERHFMAGRDNAHLYFNPRSPRGGATLHGWAGQCTPLFQSTLPTRGSDRRQAGNQDRNRAISIHAPHEGERPRSPPSDFCAIGISIHAPHEGERPIRSAFRQSYTGFQSTLPTRGSDALLKAEIENMTEISIHAPHEGERQWCKPMYNIAIRYFNPRSPRGGATGRVLL